MIEDILEALSNPVRLKLIKCLESKPKSVTDLIGSCGLSQSAVSQHLAKLRKNGIVTTNKEGKYIYYSLPHQTSVEIVDLVYKLEKEIKK